MNIVLEKMKPIDLEFIDLNDFDNFWTKNILMEEISSTSSYYIMAKCENSIIGFGGIKFLVDEAHITNIVTKIDKRNNRYSVQKF